MVADDRQEEQSEDIRTQIKQLTSNTFIPQGKAGLPITMNNNVSVLYHSVRCQGEGKGKT